MSREKLKADLAEALVLAEKLTEVTEAFCKSVRDANPHIVFDMKKYEQDLAERKARFLAQM